MELNPYESPQEVSLIPPARSWSLLRGLAYAIPLGILGFCIPLITLGGLKLFYLTDMEWNEIPWNVMGSSIICSVVFAWAAFANFSAVKGIGFIRSLLVIFIFMFISVFVLFLIRVLLFGFPRQVYESTLTPSEKLIEKMFAIIYYAIFLSFGIVFTVWQIRRIDHLP
jgi:hypothetical protein